MPVPHGAYVNVCGSDLIRNEAGDFVVLEDNLRVPSGVSYMLANRDVVRRAFPGVFRAHGRARRSSIIRWSCWRRCESLAPFHEDVSIAVLTPGVFNSAYFEHAFLARQMGVELVEGRDLLVNDNVVYTRTTSGLKRIDVIYRRIDDDFVDPLIFREDSSLGVPGLFNAYRAGNVDDRQCAGHRRRRRQGGLCLCAAPDPLLPVRRTDPGQCRDLSSAARKNRCSHVLANLDKLVVKAVGESGGYGMLVGPHASAGRARGLRARR